MNHIMKCSKCGKYTLEASCCSKKTVSPRPPKYSPEDKYADYRRKYKELNA
ncbi:ribosome biogenesis protein [Candidatus Woesearchaeota archaeon]|jgi:H/ACA ribonucleoprotein complex subunit 3|nr:ribosome biogenesis protein [Candidatus Woesearchaeota archaeon]MBT4368739.1 ribosome biogenesis protein [Candidatus Woesearchaeota archaeon]MBT4712028.1 ribosome biogenesis protein [Candidatus Woesearchaeota archaeon]MBT6638923.1 ribosome biogenesis protein [Candidatus Woesearchaeota archaeon]MBT7134567.1 ribosome biogenesis protein [Candidatus Woesearchaeota archaeon]